MNLHNAVKTIQIVLAILLVLLILIQGKGGGLASSISSTISIYRSKRGLERVVFILTIFFLVLLVLNSLVLVGLS